MIMLSISQYNPHVGLTIQYRQYSDGLQYTRECINTSNLSGVSQ